MTRRLRPSVGGLVSALAIGAVLSAVHCNLLATFTDCTADSQCNLGERCNPQRHYCEVPTPELCNGVDDNRNGIPDDQEDFGPCAVSPPPAAGMCRDGRLRCRNNSTLVCVQRAAPGPTEICNNGLDDDCDGVVDDGADCQQNYTATPSLTLGSDDPGAGEGDDAPAHQVCLPAYAIDRYEVTFQAFTTFLSELDQTKLRIEHPAHPLNPTVAYGRYLIYNDNGTDVPLALFSDVPDRLSLRQLPYGYAPLDAAAANLPIVNVTWYAADRYCRWAGKHLPSEAEYFRAARGSDGTRPYPWGSEDPTCDRANVGRGGPGGGPCVGAPLPVGTLSAGATPEGVFDLYGNANEWMWDNLDDNPTHSRNNYYESIPADAGAGAWCQAYPQGPLGPDAGSPINQPEDAGLYCVQCRFARGRHYRTVDLRIGIRRWLDADRGDPFLGFRCAQGGASR